MALREIYFDPNPHQDLFLQDRSSKFLHLSTGFGGGKTHALIMKLFDLSALNPNHAGGLLCPSYADFKRDVLPMIEGICDENNIGYKYHGTDHYFSFEWSKEKIYVVTGNEKIRGPNWAYAVINELTLIPIVRYREVIGRVRVIGSKCSQIASCGTPEGIASDYYAFFIENPPKTARVIYGDTRNNAHNLDPSYIESLEQSYDKIMLEAYLKGLWINMTGNRFYYAYDPAKHDNSNLKRIDYAVTHVGMDFNVNPMTATLWNYDGQKLTAFDEITLNDADTNKMCLALKARNYNGSNTIIYPDPAGQARSTKGQPDVEILRQHGFQNIKVKSVAPPMRQRQLNVNNLLSKGVIQLNPLQCPGLKKDLSAVEQDTVKLDKIKTNPKLTHYSDGMDYLCDILFPYSGYKPNSRVEKFR